MTRSGLKLLLLPLVLASTPWFVGCTEKVTEKDVASARQKAETEHMDLAKARTDAEKKISDQSQAARDADTKLAETEAKADATKQRDAFVAQVESELQAADKRVEDLKTTAGKQSGSAKDATNTKIKTIETNRDSVKKSLDKVKSAELLQWQVQRPFVQQALDDLHRSMS